MPSAFDLHLRELARHCARVFNGGWPLRFSLEHDNMRRLLLIRVTCGEWQVGAHIAEEELARGMRIGAGAIYIERIVTALYEQECDQLGVGVALQDAQARAMPVPPSMIGAAQERALETLKHFLSAEQLQTFEQSRWFDVTGEHTLRKYRIYWGAHSNISILNRHGRPSHRICFVPVGDLPIPDVMLAQKLALEADEMATLLVANDQGPDFENGDAALGQNVWLDEAAAIRPLGPVGMVRPGYRPAPRYVEPPPPMLDRIIQEQRWEQMRQAARMRNYL